jgi:hypothetical protein
MGTAQLVFVVVEGGCGATESDRVHMRNQKPEVTGSMLCAFPAFSRFSSYYSSSAVVPLRMTDMATGSDVIPSVSTCATVSCAISALVGHFDRK